MKGWRVWRHFDYVLLLVTILLIAYGVLMIYSANQGSPDTRLQGLWRRQAIVGAVGVGIIFLLAAFPRDYQWLGDFWWLAYALAVAMLVLVLFFGESEIGAVSGWFDLGFLRIQPSYLAMNLLTISVGRILSRGRSKRKQSEAPVLGMPKTTLGAVNGEDARPDLISYAASGGMTLLLAALVFLEPDMATAAVFVAMWLAMLSQSSIPIRYLIATVVLGLGSLIPLWQLMGRFPYMRERIMGFLSPDPTSDAVYQVRQALIAIGSGGLWGKGLGQGTQSQLRYLPVRHTDFIFSVLAEELGFAGVMLLFALYIILFFRLLRIIVITPDGFGKMIVTGTLAMILFQLVINVGMNLDQLPVAGLPLPFISYGPAALLTIMVGIGMAENVVMRHRKLEF